MAANRRRAFAGMNFRYFRTERKREREREREALGSKNLFLISADLSGYTLLSLRFREFRGNVVQLINSRSPRVHGKGEIYEERKKLAERERKRRKKTVE